MARVGKYTQQKVKYDSKQFGIYLDSDLVWDFIEMGKDVDELYPEYLKEEVVIEKRTELLHMILLPEEQHSFFYFKKLFLLADIFFCGEFRIEGPPS